MPDKPPSPQAMKVAEALWKEGYLAPFALKDKWIFDVATIIDRKMQPEWKPVTRRLKRADAGQYREVVVRFKNPKIDPGLCPFHLVRVSIHKAWHPLPNDSEEGT